MKISQKEYLDAIDLIKRFEIQERNKLPYELGHVKYGSSRWSHAKRDKKTGDVFEIFLNPITKNTHAFKIKNKSIKESFEPF